MSDRWTRRELLNIAPGGTKRQEGFEKLSIEVDNLYEIGNQLDADIKQVNDLAYNSASQAAASATNAANSATSAAIYAQTIGGFLDYTAEAKVADIITKGPWVDVRAFGAVGDGVTDVTDKINALFDLVPSGSVIRFPAGTYIVSNLTHPNKVLHIEGNSVNDTFIVGSGACTLYYGNVIGNNLSRFSSLKNIAIRGNGANHTSGTNVALRINNLGVHLENVQGTHGAIGIEVNCMVAASWKNVLGYGANKGIAIRDTTDNPYTGNQVVWLCNFTNVGVSGQNIGFSADSILGRCTFISLDAEQVPIGIQLAAGGRQNNTFINCWTEGNTIAHFNEEEGCSNTWINPYWRVAAGEGANYWSSLSQVITPMGITTNSPNSLVSIGHVAKISGSVYQMQGVTSNNKEMRSLRNSMYPANLATFSQPKSLLLDELTFSSSSNGSTLTVDIAQFTLNDAKCIGFVEFTLTAIRSTGLNPSTLRAVRSFTSDGTTMTFGTVGADIGTGITLTLTQLDNINFKASLTLVTTSMRYSGHIKFMPGIGANAGIGGYITYIGPVV